MSCDVGVGMGRGGPAVGTMEWVDWRDTLRVGQVAVVRVQVNGEASETFLDIQVRWKSADGTIAEVRDFMGDYAMRGCGGIQGYEARLAQRCCYPDSAQVAALAPGATTITASVDDYSVFTDPITRQITVIP